MEVVSWTHTTARCLPLLHSVFAIADYYFNHGCWEDAMRILQPLYRSGNIRAQATYVACLIGSSQNEQAIQLGKTVLSRAISGDNWVDINRAKLALSQAYWDHNMKGISVQYCTEIYDKFDMQDDFEVWLNCRCHYVVLLLDIGLHPTINWICRECIEFTHSSANWNPAAYIACSIYAGASSIGMKDCNSAREYLTRAISIATGYKIPHLLNTAKGFYADLLVEEGNWREALQLSIECEALGGDIACQQARSIRVAMIQYCTSSSELVLRKIQEILTTTEQYNLPVPP